MADELGLTAVIKQPWPTQQDYFRQKLNLPTAAWTDIMKQAHDRSFVVAGAMKADLLEDLRQAVDQAIAGKATLADFLRQFDDIVAKHGWDYQGGRDWRTRVIYQTNLSTSYAAGRWQQMTDPDMLKARPYWRYRHSDSVLRPRPQHVSWHGLILRANDPWWHTHYTPNGWGCQCKVFAVSECELREKYGKSGPDTAPAIQYVEHDTPDGPVQVPEGIDYGWDHAPGQAYLGQLLLNKAAATSARIGAAAVQSAVEHVGALDTLINGPWKSLVNTIYPEPGAYRPTKQRLHVGALSPAMVERIEREAGEELATAVISVDDSEIKHALRDGGGKADKRVSEADALNAVAGMFQPERIYQALDNGQPLPVYLLIYPAEEGERYVKAVVSANYRAKERDTTGKRRTIQTNTLTTLGYARLNDLDNPAQYRRIQ
ncbi:Mu-like prophage FluMu F protein gp30 [Pseudogulbenkiania sp. NH8B]|uniref:phage head morphogenesis protein n=1 Tax=Pseudogulbenkiania sp. (strain NH8B) TaxID=748280 RepID=UPI0002279B4C|nr:phage minor head protein [Pseudogulbenkiania sp. NH8B]BAK76481.1 Mu-like prophage FluMu F protein gp30 [Pseudogulbenkiania sp. NH8B]BAK76910.1 Mu-like prophage FluMu F protein gp30 [Pseudogulbenkiania sp. NH8B]